MKNRIGGGRRAQALSAVALVVSVTGVLVPQQPSFAQGEIIYSVQGAAAAVATSVSVPLEVVPRVAATQGFLSNAPEASGQVLLLDPSELAGAATTLLQVPSPQSCYAYSPDHNSCRVQTETTIPQGLPQAVGVRGASGSAEVSGDQVEEQFTRSRADYGYSELAGIYQAGGMRSEYRAERTDSGVVRTRAWVAMQDLTIRPGGAGGDAPYLVRMAGLESIAETEQSGDATQDVHRTQLRISGLQVSRVFLNAVGVDIPPTDIVIDDQGARVKDNKQSFASYLAQVNSALAPQGFQLAVTQPNVLVEDGGAKITLEGAALVISAVPNKGQSLPLPAPGNVTARLRLAFGAVKTFSYYTTLPGEDAASGGSADHNSGGFVPSPVSSEERTPPASAAGEGISSGPAPSSVDYTFASPGGEANTGPSGVNQFGADSGPVASLEGDAPGAAYGGSGGSPGSRVPAALSASAGTSAGLREPPGLLARLAAIETRDETRWLLTLGVAVWALGVYRLGRLARRGA